MEQIRRGLVFANENAYVDVSDRNTSRMRFDVFEKCLKSSLGAARSIVNYMCEVRLTSAQKKVSAINLAAQEKISNQNVEVEEIVTENYISELEAMLGAEEEEIEYRINQYKLEVEEKMKEFSLDFDAAMSKSQTFIEDINTQKKFLDDLQIIIEEKLKLLINDHTGRKYFNRFCDEKRRTLEVIDKFLSEIV